MKKVTCRQLPITKTIFVGTISFALAIVLLSGLFLAKWEKRPHLSQSKRQLKTFGNGGNDSDFQTVLDIFQAKPVPGKYQITPEKYPPKYVLEESE